MPAPATIGKKEQVWRLRPALTVDAPVLAVIHGELFQRGWDARTFTTFLSDSSVIGIVAEEAEAMIGLVLCRVVADEAEVLTIAVGPLYQQRGIGRALLEAAFEVARQRGAEVIFLEVAQSNAAALALYEKTGFFCIGEREGYYRRWQEGRMTSETALVLRRELLPSQ